jgi:NADH dehydrogenase FAD-containing subunit
LEQAEAEEDVSRHRDLLTFVLVGGGPTGVRSIEQLVGLSVFQLVETHCKSYRQMAPAEAARAFKGLRTIHTPDEMS